MLHVGSFFYTSFFSTCVLPGQFLVQNVVPQESGECAKVKVKVRVNVHGVFSVSSASSVETVKTAEGEEPMETDQTVKEEEVCVCLQWVEGKNYVCMCERSRREGKTQLTVLLSLLCLKH